MSKFYTRKGLVAGFGGLATSALIAGAAFACVPQATLSASPSSGAAGTTITLTGGSGAGNWDAAGGPISIFWDRPGGTLLGTTTVGTAASTRNFSLQVQVPADATGGSHILYATQSDANGQAVPGTPARAVFRVTDAPPAPAAPVNAQQTPEDAQGAAGLAPAPAASPAPAPAPAPAASPAPAPAPAPARVTTPAPTPARVVTAPAPTTARVTTPAPAPARAVTTPAPAPAAAPAPAPAVPTPAPAVVPEPAPQVTPAPAVPADSGAETTTPAVEPAPVQAAGQDSGTSGWLLAGLAVLALGLFGVGTGIFLNERKRSRARS